MTHLYLIRHATHDLLPHTLAGRSPGVHLNAAGREEASGLANALSTHQMAAVFSSPLERCRETAAPIAAKLRIELQISDALMEVDFGAWTGLKISELDLRKDWKQWNAFRSGSRVPNGETMIEVQSRIVGFIAEMRANFSGKRVAIVGHGDPLRAAILYYLGMASEHIRRIELGTASVSVLAFTEWDVQLQCLNARFAADGTLTLPI